MQKQRYNTTQEIAAWITKIRLRDIPKKVRRRAKQHVLDGFATVVAGANEEASRRIDGHLHSLGGKPEATIVGTRAKAPAEHAALANGVRGHVLDYDDTQLATLRTRPFGQLTHPTTPVLAAAAALSEKIHASGAEFLSAYIVGVEIACRLADVVDPRHYLNGFHPTGTLGTFGAAAACAHLLKLDRPRIASALGIAGSLAAGLRAQRGTMTKALNAGRAAENGVVAATLACDGFTASDNIFDDPMGFFSAACYGSVDRIRLQFGRPFFFADPGVAIKFYPCAGVIHPALDALIAVLERYNILPQEIKFVRIGIGKDAALPLVYDRPRTGLEGKFSLPFSAALGVVYRRASLRDYTDQRVQNSRIHKMMARVEFVRIPKLKSIGNLGAPAKIEIITNEGRRYIQSASLAKGHPKKPLSRAELDDKFLQCARGQLSRQRAEKFIAAIDHLERIRSISALLRLLSPPRR